MARHTPLLFLLAALNGAPLFAQVNDKGTVHLGIGFAWGGHATEYERTLTILGVRLNEKTTGGAATVTVPIDVHVGITPGFSLGAYVGSGAYLDTNDTKTNRISMIGLQPRFYLVNRDRFAWTASAQLGATRLRIDSKERFGETTSTFGGTHFGLATGVIFQFTDLIGLDLNLLLLNNRLPLREYSIDGRSQSLKDWEAELRARGVALQASLAFRF